MRTEILSRRKDGSTFWAGISLEPIRNATGQVTHYVSIGADITGRLEETRDRRSLTLDPTGAGPGGEGRAPMVSLA